MQILQLNEVRKLHGGAMQTLHVIFTAYDFLDSVDSMEHLVSTFKFLLPTSMTIVHDITSCKNERFFLHSHYFCSRMIGKTTLSIIKSTPLSIFTEKG